jgi:hypothetical protein
MSRASSAVPSAPPSSGGAISATGVAAAAITLGYALQVYRAALAYRPMIALTGAIVLAAQSVLLPRVRLERGREERLLVVAGIIAIAYGASAAPGSDTICTDQEADIVAARDR